jgi:amidophosphoribosyltransferase
MCGILGVVATTPVNQLLYDGLLVLQHRGQDAAGIVTAQGSAFHMHKGSGLVRDVFRTRDMRNLQGTVGHRPLPLSDGRLRVQRGGVAAVLREQPRSASSLGHNGNLTNAEQLKRDLFQADFRHVNTDSDSEVLLNVLAHELQRTATACLDPDDDLHRGRRRAPALPRRLRVIALIAGHGLLAFRDPYGIRPLVFGRARDRHGTEYMSQSESVALDALGFA